MAEGRPLASYFAYKEERARLCMGATRPHTHTHTDGLPTVVLEVAVFNETEEDLLAEGSEWLDLPTTQVCYSRTDYA